MSRGCNDDAYGYHFLKIEINKFVTSPHFNFGTDNYSQTCIKPPCTAVLNGHPLLSGQLKKSQKFLLLITLNVTSIKRSPLLSGRGHRLRIMCTIGGLGRYIGRYIGR